MRALFKIYRARAEQGTLVVSTCHAGPRGAGHLVLPTELTDMLDKASFTLARHDARQRLVGLLGGCYCAPYEEHLGVRNCTKLSDDVKDEVLARLARGVVCGVDRVELCPTAFHEEVLRLVGYESCFERLEPAFEKVSALVSPLLGRTELSCLS